MKTRIEMYEKAIRDLEEAKLKQVKFTTRYQNINIWVECVLLAGMMVTVYILVHLTPALF